MKMLTKRLRLSLALATLICSSVPLLAAETPDRPPNIPTNFDKATVARLLNDVDQGQNDSILKIGYFLNRRRPLFPVTQGYQMAIGYLQVEVPYSRRWFTLQSLVGWAAIRLRQGDATQGLEAYSQVFSHYQEARRADASAVARSAIYEYVSVVSNPGNSLSWDGADEREVQRVLQEAFLASLVLGEREGFSPNWSTAIRPDSKEEVSKFVQDIQSNLETQKTGVTLESIKSASTVLLQLDPQKALTLLKENEARFTGVQHEWYEDATVDGLENQGQVKKAHTLQAERVNKSGLGYFRLLRSSIYLKNLNQTGWEEVDAVLARISTSKEKGEEIIEISKFLKELGESGNPLYKKEEVYPRAVKLLTAYVEENQSKHSKSTLLARYYAASMLFALRNKEEGLRVSTIANLTDLSIEEKAIYESLLKLRSNYS